MKLHNDYERKTWIEVFASTCNADSADNAVNLFRERNNRKNFRDMQWMLLRVAKSLETAGDLETAKEIHAVVEILK